MSDPNAHDLLMEIIAALNRNRHDINELLRRLDRHEIRDLIATLDLDHVTLDDDQPDQSVCDGTSSAAPTVLPTSTLTGSSEPTTRHDNTTS